MKNLGIYIHIPFCKKKCPYCDFYTLPHNFDLEKEYISTILLELKSYSNKDYLIDTIYFGGGTPSLAYKQIPTIINQIDKNFKLSPQAEITVECNPCSSGYDLFKTLKDSSVNRISLGVQSFVQTDLKILGRTHSIEDIKNAVNTCRNLNFENISIDLMIATPNQTMSDLEQTFDFLQNLDVQHISMYILKIEPGTLFYKQDMSRYIADDENVSDMYIYSTQRLESMDFKQYEISNFCKDDLKSKHNLKYWRCEEYIGIGASAHSYINNKRYAHKKNIKEYINDYTSTLIDIDKNINHFEEYIMLNLRLCEGISLNYLSNNFNIDIEIFKNKLNKFKSNDLIIIDQDKVHLTKRGFLISNYIISNILY